jgi:hypothetical protein
MSDKKLNAIKEIEFRINRVKNTCNNKDSYSDKDTLIDEIDTLLFDINDFINDLKDTDETN